MSFLKFTDFKQSQLIGMNVLWLIKDAVTKNKFSQISVITNTSRIGFQIQDQDDKWFSYTGQQRGFRSAPGNFSVCRLITQQTAQEIRNQWEEIVQRDMLISFIKSVDLKKVPIQDLKDFCNKLQLLDQDIVEITSDNNGTLTDAIIDTQNCIREDHSRSIIKRENRFTTNKIRTPKNFKR